MIWKKHFSVISTSQLDKQDKKSKTTGWEDSATGIYQERQLWAQTGSWKPPLWTPDPWKSPYHLHLLLPKGPILKTEADSWIWVSVEFSSLRHHTNSIVLHLSLIQRAKHPPPNPKTSSLRRKTHVYPSIQLFHLPTTINRGSSYHGGVFHFCRSII